MLIANITILIIVMLIYLGWRDWLAYKKTCGKISKKISLAEANLREFGLIVNRYPYPHASLREALQSDWKRLGWIPRRGRG